MSLRWKSAGRAPAWQVEEDVAIVAAVVNLPGASVDGANMKAFLVESAGFRWLSRIS
jgi:hypothetical protein